MALSDYTPTWSHNFSVNGGTSNVNYYGSVGTTFEGGIYTNSATSFRRVNVNLAADIDVNKYYAYDKSFSKRKRFEKPFKLYSFDKSAYLNAGNIGKEDGSDFLIPVQRADVSEPQLTDNFSTSHRSTLNIKLDYDRSLHGGHNISAFVAYEQHKYRGEGIQAFRRFFKSDQLPYLFAGGDAQKDNSGWVGIDGSVSYFGRLDYNYKETYLLQLGFRKDGSLRFAEEHRWGNFPSILAGWRPSQYNWWQDNLDFIDQFKLKASWGEMGNDRVPAWQYLSAFGFGTGVVLGENRTYSDALYQRNTPNLLITWETAYVYNVGWEMTLLDYRLTFAADFFYQRRSDILVQRDASVPEFTGLDLPDENFGIVDNKGFEVVLGYQEVQPEFSYGVNANFAFVRNTVIEMDEPARNVPWQVRTGHPMGAALVYKSAGIFRDEEQVNSLPHVSGARPGDIIIGDYDGDGEITPDDRILLHQTPVPEITYGVSFNASYKSWSLSGLIQGVGGTMKRMYRETRQGQSGNYFQYDAEGRWTPDNKVASKPRAFIRLEEYWRGAYITDYMYSESDFGRLKNLRLSYTLPENILNAIHMEEAQIYLSGRNLFLIYSENKRIDPEVTSGITYPLMRVFSVGGRFTF